MITGDESDTLKGKFKYTETLPEECCGNCLFFSEGGWCWCETHQFQCKECGHCVDWQT